MNSNSERKSITRSAKLVSSEHGFDDYNVEGIPTVHRVTIGHGIRKGDNFNVYCDAGRKIGSVWQGTLDKSLAHLAAQLVAEEVKPGILEVAAAMEKVGAERLLSSDPLWWNDPEINRVLSAGVAAGHLSRLSTTQVHWTESGVQALKAARDADRNAPVRTVPQASLLATQTALSDAMQTIDTLRHALEVIGVGDAQDPKAVAKEALEKTGIWEEQEPEESPSAPSFDA